MGLRPTQVDEDRRDSKVPSFAVGARFRYRTPTVREGTVLQRSGTIESDNRARAGRKEQTVFGWFE
jgi:hypothetical protein